MRSKADVLFDYGKLLRSEGTINLTDIELKESVKTPEGQSMLQELLDKDLMDYEFYDGQQISTLRAFKIYCEIVIKSDVASGMLVWNNFVKMQFELVERNSLSCYLAARSHGKSYFACLYLSFKMYISPSFEVLATFNIPKMIKRFFRVFRRIIDNNNFLLEKKDTSNMKTLIWGQTECEYNGGLITGMTLGSTPRSAHVNMIWTDDILRSDNKYTKEYIKNYILGELMPCIRRKKGRFVVEGTPFDENDIYHHLFEDKNKKVKRALLLCTHSGVFKSAKGWACRIFPAILDHKTKQVLVPEAYTYEEIMAEVDKIGEYRFFREFMCKCEINKSALISYHMFMKNIDEKETLQEIAREGGRYVMFVDPSAGEGEESDYAAIIVIEKGSGKLILRYVWHERLLPIIDPDGTNIDLTHKVINTFNDFNSYHRCELWIENNSIGRILIQNLRRYNVDPYEHNAKDDKVEMIMSVISMLKSDGKVVIPYHPDCAYTQENVPMLRNECINFGIRKVRDKIVAGATSGNDDLFIAFVGALRYACDEDDTGSGSAVCITQN